MPLLELRSVRRRERRLFRLLLTKLPAVAARAMRALEATSWLPVMEERVAAEAMLEPEVHE